MLTCSLLAEISCLLATTTEQRSSKPILALNALVSYLLHSICISSVVNGRERHSKSVQISTIQQTKNSPVCLKINLTFFMPHQHYLLFRSIIPGESQ
jgi:hypothetical protein